MGRGLGAIPRKHIGFFLPDPPPLSAVGVSNLVRGQLFERGGEVTVPTPPNNRLQPTGRGREGSQLPIKSTRRVQRVAWDANFPGGHNDGANFAGTRGQANRGQLPRGRGWMRCFPCFLEILFLVSVCRLLFWLHRTAFRQTSCQMTVSSPSPELLSLPSHRRPPKHSKLTQVNLHNPGLFLVRPRHRRVSPRFSLFGFRLIYSSKGHTPSGPLAEALTMRAPYRLSSSVITFYPYYILLYFTP